MKENKKVRKILEQFFAQPGYGMPTGGGYPSGLGGGLASVIPFYAITNKLQQKDNYYEQRKLMCGDDEECIEKLEKQQRRDTYKIIGKEIGKLGIIFVGLPVAINAIGSIPVVQSAMGAIGKVGQVAANKISSVIAPWSQAFGTIVGSLHQLNMATMSLASIKQALSMFRGDPEVDKILDEIEDTEKEAEETKRKASELDKEIEAFQEKLKSANSKDLTPRENFDAEKREIERRMMEVNRRAKDVVMRAQELMRRKEASIRESFELQTKPLKNRIDEEVIKKIDKKGPFFKPRYRVSVIILSKDNKKVILGYSKDPKSESEKYVVPGGDIRPDESIEEAAEREALEEIGVQIINPVVLGGKYTLVRRTPEYTVVDENREDNYNGVVNFIVVARMGKIKDKINNEAYPFKVSIDEAIEILEMMYPLTPEEFKWSAYVLRHNVKVLRKLKETNELLKRDLDYEIKKKSKEYDKKSFDFFQYNINVLYPSEYMDEGEIEEVIERLKSKYKRLLEIVYNEIVETFGNERVGFESSDVSLYLEPRKMIILDPQKNKIIFYFSITGGNLDGNKVRVIIKDNIVTNVEVYMEN